RADPGSTDHDAGARDRRAGAGGGFGRGALARVRPWLRSSVPAAREARPVSEEGQNVTGLREPNLPASARRVATGKLRKGWTTGTCSAAAAKAACLLLRDGEPPDEVEIPLVKGEQRARFTPERC